MRLSSNLRIFCEGNFLIDNTARIELANPRYGFDVPLGSSAGFTTAVLPQASAGARPRAMFDRGTFQGMT